MFAATCSRCATRSIIPETRIVDVQRSDAGFTVRYRCWCGAESAHFTASCRRRAPRARRGERPEPLPSIAPRFAG